jgi:vacuolar-type H+-ATPase catalytic subunit A/Vma1
MMGKPREQGELFAMLVGNASLARTDALLVDTREAIESRFAREHRHAQVAEECALVSNLLALEAIQKMDLEKQEHVAFGGEILARLAAVRSARDAPFPIAPELLAVAGSEIRF